MTDLDKSGHGFQRVRTYLGPTLGWTDELVQPTTEVRAAGTYVVQPGDSVILVNVAASVTIQLPDVRSWVQQTASQPATGFERSITIKDIGGNAANFNIVVVPFGQQSLDNIQQAIVISQSRAAIKLIPLIDMTGWAVALASISGSGTGGGDVFKAGNNTFTGTNIFQGQVTVPNLDPADDSQQVANTGFVKDQNYITGAALTPYALIASPTFTGVPKAPTPAPSDDDATIVTIAFVENALAAFTGGAPPNAEYITSTSNSGLSAERVLTNTATITWDFSTPGQAKATTAVGGGNVSSANSPVNGQIARWTTPTTIEGINQSVITAGLAPIDSPAFTGNPTAPTPLTSDNDTSIATTGFVKSNMVGFQPLDADLTALSSLTGTNTLYYRSAPDIWSPVTYSGLAFSGGVLTVTAGGGNVSNSGTPVDNQIAVWTDAFHIEGLTPAAAGLQPLDGDLTSLSNANTTNSMYYRSAAETWSPVTVGAGISFTGGTLTGTAPPMQQVGFRANKNGVDQVLPGAGTATKLSFGFEDYDVGGFYNTSLQRWTPPAGVVHLTAIVFISSGATPGNTANMYILKNGIDLKLAVCTQSQAFGGMQISVDDVANGSDFYEAAAAVVGTNPTIGGNTLLTFFQGHMTGGPQGVAGPAGTAGGVQSANPPKFIFTTQTYTPSPNLAFVMLEGVGGGGAGGGVTGISGNHLTGGGGGSSAYVRIILSAATVSNGLGISIGAGGAGAVAATGGNGGSTNITGKQFTASAGSPDITCNNHGLVVDQAIGFTTTGTLPGGLGGQTNFYVLALGLTANVFRVGTVKGGTAIVLSTAGTGVLSLHHMYCEPGFGGSFTNGGGFPVGGTAGRTLSNTVIGDLAFNGEQGFFGTYQVSPTCQTAGGGGGSARIGGSGAPAQFTVAGICVNGISSSGFGGGGSGACSNNTTSSGAGGTGGLGGVIITEFLKV